MKLFFLILPCLAVLSCSKGKNSNPAPPVTTDTADKFTRISDSALLDLVQSQTLKYFWDFGHPVSGMARERATSGDLVTTGGTGFGIMAMIAGIKRNFISRADGLNRIRTIVGFLAGLFA